MAALSLVQRYRFFDANLAVVRREHYRLLATTWLLGAICGGITVAAICYA